MADILKEDFHCWIHYLFSFYNPKITLFEKKFDIKVLTHVKVSVRCLFKRRLTQSFSVVITFVGFIFKGN